MRVTFPPGFDGRNRRGESFAKQKDGGVFQLDSRSDRQAALVTLARFSQVSAPQLVDEALAIM
jgi:hypothetical protein